MRRDVALAGLTTLGVGGPARLLADCADAADIDAALAAARAAGLPVTVLGDGSNLLAADTGFPGLLLRIGDGALVELGVREGRVRWRVGAGLGWDALVARAVAAGLAGVECLSGIPGRVGAAPVQNIGAYGQELAETLDAVHAIELASGEPCRIAAAACGFGYRTSRFKTDWRGRFAITAIELALEPRPSAPVRYPELRQRVGAAAAPLAELRAAVLATRRSKSMVLDPGDPNRRSAGSFFLNPVLAEGRAAEVEAVAGSPAPRFAAGPGQVKLPAAWLIEQAGFARGHARGRAGISTNHVLALVNRGGATAAEIVALALEIRERVAERFGVRLEPEPIRLGFAADPFTV